MKGQFWLAALLACILTACGGGGGGGSSGGEFTLSESTVEISAGAGEPPPESRSVLLQVTGSKVAFAGAAFLRGPQPSWLEADITGTAPNFTLVLSIIDTDLEAGTYSSAVSVGTADADGKVLESRDIVVRYHVEERLKLLSAPISFNMQAGAKPSARTHAVSVRASGIDYRVSSDAAWLKVPSGVQQSVGAFDATVDSAGLAVGTYHGQISLVNTSRESDRVTQAATLIIRAPAMSITSLPAVASLVLGGPQKTATRTVRVEGDSTEFLVRSDAAWLKVPAAQKTSPGDFDISIDGTGLGVGTHEALLSVVNVYDETIRTTQKVTLSILSPIMTIASAPGVANLVLGGPPTVATHTIQVQGDISAFTAASSVPWLKVPVGSLDSPGSFNVTIDSSGLAIGTHEALVTLTNSYDGSVRATQSVTLNIRAPVMNIDSGPIAHALIYGHSDMTRTGTVRVAGDPTVFTASSNVAWLKVPTGERTAPGNFEVAIDASNVGVGTHDGVITITNKYAPSVKSTTSVRLTVTEPTISLLSDVSQLGGNDGRGAQTGTVSFSINTGTNRYPWTAKIKTENGVAWLTASVANGQFGSSPANFDVNLLRSKLSEGRYNAEISISTTIRGRTISKTVPITATAPINRLFASALGVAFSKFPSRQLLERDVTIRSTEGYADISWTATSSRSWLKVTAAGASGGTLKLTATPGNLAPNTLHEATVTVSSPAKAVENTQRIRVGLWIGDTDPQTVMVRDDLSYGSQPSPTAPYLFISELQSDIKVFNIYTGALVKTYTGLGERFENLLISPDGDTLFAVESSRKEVLAIDVASGAVTATYPFTPRQFGPEGANLAVLRPRAYPLLSISTDRLAIHDLEAGILLKAVEQRLWPEAVAPDNLSFYVNSGSGPGTITRYSIDYSELREPLVSVTAREYLPMSNYITAITAPVDGSKVLVALELRFDVLSPELMKLRSSGTILPRPRRAVGTWNGLYVIGGERGHSSLPDEIFVYGPDEVLIHSLASDSDYNSSIGFHVSGDATRLILSGIYGGNRSMVFRDLLP